MSKVLNFTSSGNVGPSNGSRVASVLLAAGSATATLTLTDTATSSIVLTAVANTCFEWIAGDAPQGAEFFGQLAAVLTGAGASYSIEFL